MTDGTTHVLASALEAARQRGISTIVVASTTGRTAIELCAMIDNLNYHIVVVAHRPKRGVDRFETAARQKLTEKGIVVFNREEGIARSGTLHKLLRKLWLSPWQRKLKTIKSVHGIGICVCHKILWMLIQSGSLKTGEIIAIAGTNKGADSAGIFEVTGEKMRPMLLKVITRPVRKSIGV